MNELILLGLFLCHWSHLSTAYMLNEKRLGTPLHPIFLHAFIHASLMLVFLALAVRLDSLLLTVLFLFQLVTHFLIDVWKGRMNGWFPSLQSPANKWHWVIFGFDQFLHTTVIVIMYHLINNK